MKSSKKRFLSVVAVAVASLAFTMLAACSAPPVMATVSEADYASLYDAYGKLSVTAEGEIEILQLSDLHLFSASTKNDKKTLENVEKLLERDFDLVAVTGDLVEGYNKKSYYDKEAALAAFADIFERKEQYWFFAAGNNDGEYCGDNAAVIKKLSEYPHCLIADAKDVGGEGNYYIDVKDAGNATVYRVIAADTGHRDAEGNYLEADGSQVEWYKSLAAESAASGIPTGTFTHRVFTKMSDAIAHGRPVATYDFSALYSDITDSAGYDKLADAVLGSTVNGLIAAGHLHANDCARFYNGVYWLNVATASANNLKNEKSVKGGGTLITVNPKNAVEGAYAFEKLLF